MDRFFKTKPSSTFRSVTLLYWSFTNDKGRTKEGIQDKERKTKDGWQRKKGEGPRTKDIGRKTKYEGQKKTNPGIWFSCMMCFRIQILMTYAMYDRCSSVTGRKGLNFYLCSLVSLLLGEWASGDPGATCSKGSKTSRCGDPSLHFHERDLQHLC